MPTSVVKAYFGDFKGSILNVSSSSGYRNGGWKEDQQRFACTVTKRLLPKAKLIHIGLKSIADGERNVSFINAKCCALVFRRTTFQNNIQVSCFSSRTFPVLSRRVCLHLPFK